jgi:hypothetical protein
MRGSSGSALRAAEALLARGAARPGAASGASERDAPTRADAPRPARVPILEALGADELRLVVERLLRRPGSEPAVHRLRCCARAFRAAITNDDLARHVRRLALGREHCAYRAPFGSTPFNSRHAVPPKLASMPRQTFVGRRPRPTGVARFSRREAPYELEVLPPEGEEELRYVNPIIVLDRSTGRFRECVLLVDQRGMLSQIVE